MRFITVSHSGRYIEENIIMFPVFQPIFAFQPTKLSALKITDKKNLQKIPSLFKKIYFDYKSI